MRWANNELLVDSGLISGGSLCFEGSLTGIEAEEGIDRFDSQSEYDRTSEVLKDLHDNLKAVDNEYSTSKRWRVEASIVSMWTIVLDSRLPLITPVIARGRSAGFASPLLVR